MAMFVPSVRVFAHKLLNQRLVIIISILAGSVKIVDTQRSIALQDLTLIL